MEGGSQKSSIRISRSSRRSATPKLVYFHCSKTQGSDHYSLQYKQKPHPRPTLVPSHPIRHCEYSRYHNFLFEPKMPLVISSSFKTKNIGYFLPGRSRLGCELNVNNIPRTMTKGCSGVASTGKTHTEEVLFAPLHVLIAYNSILIKLVAERRYLSHRLLESLECRLSDWADRTDSLI
jgi:hypothetical protein